MQLAGWLQHNTSTKSEKILGQTWVSLIFFITYYKLNIIKISNIYS